PHVTWVKNMGHHFHPFPGTPAITAWVPTKRVYHSFKFQVTYTNLEFSRWNEIFPDPMMTAALVDRLTHHAYILNMNGESYRLKQRLKRASNKNAGILQGGDTV
ncbi:MAG: ATP-binding protein, partial [Bacillota bacterium]